MKYVGMTVMWCPGCSQPHRIVAAGSMKYRVLHDGPKHSFPVTVSTMPCCGVQLESTKAFGILP